MHTDRQDERQQVTRRRSQIGGNSESRSVHGTVLFSDLAPAVRREHQAVLGLIDQLLLNDEADDRPALWEELSTELHAHTDAEQEIIYRQLAKVRSLRSKTARAVEQHDDIRQLLEEMHDLDACGARFLARLAKLRYTVSRHVEEDETLLLPLAEKLFDVAALDKMAEDFMLRKMELLEQLRGEPSFG